MNILDHVEENTDRYEPSLIIIIALGSLVLLGLGLQFEAIYSNFLVNKSRIEEPGLMICFFSPYSKRWIVQLFGVLGIGLSCSILYKRHWKLFESILFNSVLLSPIVIFVLDQIMIIKILN